jgi:hypothetical protein
VRSHYRKVWREIAIDKPVERPEMLQPIMVIPVQGWNRVTKEALQFAMTLSKDIKILHAEDDAVPDDFPKEWREFVEGPAKAANLPLPELVLMKSPYRFILSPIVTYVVQLARENPTRSVVAVVPELVEKRWYYYFLHSQRAALLKAQLLMKGHDRIYVLNIPWYLKSG